MKSSFGSDAFALLAVACISTFVLLLLRHFLPLRTTPAYLVVPIFLALALPISIILLVPIDLNSSLGTDSVALQGIWLPQTVILVVWRLTYWLTFALTWLILPLLGEYVDSGYRSPKDRIFYSLRSNGRYQLIVVACAAAGGIYVFLQNGFRGSSIKSLVMALAYCWGLVMAIYLMGHGLVAVPRRLIRNANVDGSLKRIQSRAPKAYDQMTDATTELEELENQLTQLRKRKNAVSRDHEEWIEDISDASNVPDSRLSTTTTLAPGTSAPTLPAVITDRYLAELTRRLIRARHKRVRFVDAWDRLLQEAIRTQAIIDARISKRLDLGKGSPHSSWFERTSVLTPYARYLLHSKIKPGIRVAFGVLSSIASFFIVWSELVKFIAPKLSIISLTILSHDSDDETQVGFGGQVIASVWLLYMSIATLASFDDVRIWGNRALVRRNTYGESATWYSGQIAKLTVPLAYNFLTFLPPQVHKKTTFYNFLGKLIVLTPLWKGFDYFFPMFILVPVSATLFDLYGRVKNIFGFGILQSDEEGDPNDSDTRGWREGRALIERELHSTAKHNFARRLGEPSAPLALGASSAGGSRQRQSEGLLGQSSQPDDVQPSTYAQQQSQRLAEATAAAEEEDETFFQGFAHRVKNTIDSVERPEWMQELGKRPKWMGGVQGNAESSGRAESGRGMGRWFGGRPADGRVRL